MKLTKYLTEAKRGDHIYVIYSNSAKRVLSATMNPKKLLEIINNADRGRSGYTNTNLAKLEMEGQDDFGSGSNKVIIFKTIIL